MLHHVKYNEIAYGQQKKFIDVYIFLKNAKRQNIIKQLPNW